VFVLLPVFFGGSLTHWDSLWAALVAFFAFSFIASSVYCFNDIIDVEADRRHPVKCHRPVASGEVSKVQAYGLMALMFILSMLASGFLLSGSSRLSVVGVILLYYVLNIGYCAWFKRYAIVDVCIIAFGFVLRLLAGGLAAHVELSKWIVLMTFLLTLFLSFAKRRDDVVRMEQTGEAPRKNTSRYNLTFINQAITITASVTLVCYIMYTVSPDVQAQWNTPYLYLTSVFVILGLLRYIQITVVDEQSGDPTRIMLNDRFIQIDVLLWALSFLIIIYVL
jgi:4-hydroxybenzoate polyprenyltransferase